MPTPTPGMIIHPKIDAEPGGLVITIWSGANPYSRDDRRPSATRERRSPRPQPQPQRP